MASDLRILQNVKVFRDGLPGELRSFGELSNGKPLSSAEFRQQRQSCLVSQRGEDGRVSAALFPGFSVSFG